MIAIIPARSGSQGLKNKNILKLNGKSLIGYTIEAALKSKKISKVIVSTNSEKIAKIAKSFGASVPFLRPKNLATSKSKSIDTYIYTINKIEEQTNKHINSFICLLPTCPLRDSKDIDNAIRLFNKKKADSVISITNADYPIEWNFSLGSNSILKKIIKNSSETDNRQKFKSLFIPNGAIYIFKKKKIFKHKRFFFKKTYGYKMSKLKSIDIDNIDDFRYVSYILKKNK